MDTTKIEGQLEIDHSRGVIYFHSNDGITILRICNLPKPIPNENQLTNSGLDITHMVNANWIGETNKYFTNSKEIK